jgi:lipopolysaccharide assembly outer membrane protein LptD (OstA)
MPLARLVPALLLASAALAANFANFNIQPTGSQNLDLASGVTTLPQGGRVSDTSAGFSVTAKWIQYKDGVFLSARQALVTTQDGGKVRADLVNYQVATKLMRASGHLLYSDRRVVHLTAARATYNTATQIVVVTGSVRAQQPALSATELMVDYLKKQALLVGRYRYAYQGTSLSNNAPSGVLLLQWSPSGAVQVTTEPSAAQLAPYRPYL